MRLKYLSFENAGQLPRPYPENVTHGTSVVDPFFNDMNREEPTTYTTLESCDYLVELREHNDDDGRNFDSSEWKIREEFPFLNRNSCSGLRRAFWIPFIPNPCGLRVACYWRGAVVVVMVVVLTEMVMGVFLIRSCNG